MKHVFFMLVTAVTALHAQQQKEYRYAYLNFKETSIYTFEMDVTELKKKSMKLRSSKVFKQTKIEFEPDENTDEDSPYAIYKYSYDFGKSEDSTVSLEFDLSDFTESNGSYWASESQLRFKEKFQPGGTAVDALTVLLDKHDIKDEDERDDILRSHAYLASTYVLENPFSYEYQESKVFDKVFRAKNVVNDNDLSFTTTMVFDNFSFFARMNRERLNMKYIDSFYYSKSYRFSKIFFDSVRKSKDVLYTYFIYRLTGVIPEKVTRENPNYSYKDDSRPQFDTIEVPGSDGFLNCTKKDKKRYTCVIGFEFYSKIKMPSSETVKNHSYPKFITNDLQENGMTNERFNSEMNDIDLSVFKQ